MSGMVIPNKTHVIMLYTLPSRYLMLHFSNQFTPASTEKYNIAQIVMREKERLIWKVIEFLFLDIVLRPAAFFGSFYTEPIASLVLLTNFRSFRKTLKNRCRYVPMVLNEELKIWEVYFVIFFFCIFSYLIGEEIYFYGIGIVEKGIDRNPWSL